MESVAVAALVVAALVGLVLGRAWWARPDRRFRRLLARAKSTPIAGLKDGAWARVTGTVSAGAPLLTSPVGEQGCVGFRLRVERVDGVAATAFERQACVAFSIADDTGKLDVEGPCLLTLDAQGDWSTMRPRLLELLEAAGVAGLGLSSYRGFAFREALLRPGDRVSVLGLAFFEPDPQARGAGFRSPPLALCMRGSASQPVVVVADDGQPARG